MMGSSATKHTTAALAAGHKAGTRSWTLWVSGVFGVHIRKRLELSSIVEFGRELKIAELRQTKTKNDRDNY